MSWICEGNPKIGYAELIVGFSSLSLNSVFLQPHQMRIFYIVLDEKPYKSRLKLAHAGVGRIDFMVKVRRITRKVILNIMLILIESLQIRPWCFIPYDLKSNMP